MTKCKHMTPIKAQYDEMIPTATISDTKKETNNTSNT